MSLPSLCFVQARLQTDDWVEVFDPSVCCTGSLALIQHMTEANRARVNFIGALTGASKTVARKYVRKAYNIIKSQKDAGFELNEEARVLSLKLTRVAGQEAFPSRCSVFEASTSASNLEPDRRFCTRALYDLMGGPLEGVNFLQKLGKHILEPIKALPSSKDQLEEDLQAARALLIPYSRSLRDTDACYHLLLEDLLSAKGPATVDFFLRHPFFWTPDDCMEFIGKVSDFQNNQANFKAGYDQWWTLSSWLDKAYTSYRKKYKTEEPPKVTAGGEGWWCLFGLQKAWQDRFPYKKGHGGQQQARSDMNHKDERGTEWPAWKALLGLVRDHQVHQPFLNGGWARGFINRVPFLVCALWVYIQDGKGFREHPTLSERYFS